MRCSWPRRACCAAAQESRGEHCNPRALLQPRILSHSRPRPRQMVYHESILLCVGKLLMLILMAQAFDRLVSINSTCHIRVVLVKPFLDRNVGAVARCMLNFGLKDLALVEPQCEHLSQVALFLLSCEGRGLFRKVKVTYMRSTGCFHLGCRCRGRPSRSQNLPRGEMNDKSVSARAI